MHCSAMDSGGSGLESWIDSWLGSPGDDNEGQSGEEQLPPGEPSVEELREMLRYRDQAIADLEQELEHLQRPPDELAERIARLEDALAQVETGSILRLRSPVLKRIRKAIRDDHTLEHGQAFMDQADRSGQRAFEEATVVDAKSLVLGRGYVPLEKEVKVKAPPLHPVISDLHYAGTLVRRHEETQAVHMGSGGQLTYSPLPEAHPDRFWLERPYRQAPPQDMLSRDSDAYLVASHDEAGPGADLRPYDWLGMAKRGMPVEPPPQKAEWRLPSWLY